jgi:hypothetical protein
MGIDDEMGAIIHRMMRDLDDDDHEPNSKPRCEGCGARLPLEPYELRASNGSAEWVMYCSQCRALAEIVNGTQFEIDEVE